MKKQLLISLFMLLAVFLPLTAEEIQIGNGTSSTNEMPITFYYKNSLSETIYYAEEFEEQGVNGGSITHLTYYFNFIEHLVNYPINIWMGETTLNSLPTSWIPAGELTQVFSGMLSFLFDEGEVEIELDEPYNYSGDNLVVMVERVLDTEFYDSMNVFYYEETPEFPGRSLSKYSDINDFDPYSPPVYPYVISGVPNSRFEFDFEGLGSLNGYVNDAVTGTGLEGAIVELTQQNRVTGITNSNGYYEFPGLLAGDYEAHVSLFGYIDTTMMLTIIDDEVTVQDIDLIPLDRVNIFGRIVGSDNLAMGIEGAELFLEGIEDYAITGNDDGIFQFSNVLANSIYQLTVITDLYETYIYTVDLGSEDLDLGDLIVNEISFPANNVMAAINNEDTEALISWRSPGNSIEVFYDFEIDDGDFETNDPFGWSWGVDATLGANSGNCAWVTVLNENYVNFADWQLTSPEIAIDNAAMQLSFYHNMNCENSWDGGNVKISMDGGSSWELIIPEGGYPENNVFALEEPGFSYGFTDWSRVVFDLSAYQGEDVMFKWHFGSDSVENDFLGWAIDDVRIGNHEIRTLEGYSVFRGLLGDEANVDDWDLIAENVTDTCFTDESWEDISGTGIYRYAVRAEYTYGILSEAGFSNWVAANMIADVIVNITTNSGDIPEGALVNLRSTQPGPQGDYVEYNGMADAQGVCVLHRVLMSNYDLEVELFGFTKYQGNIEVDGDIAIDIEITELAFPPGLATVEVSHSGSALLSWHSPIEPPATSWDFEDDDGEFIGNSGWVCGAESNSGTAHSGDNCWSLWPGYNYPISSNTSLYTPVVNIPNENTQLTFYHWYDIEEDWDGGNVKISSDGGETWILIFPVQGYPEDAAMASNAGIPGEACWNGTSGDWVLATFELADYAGEDVMIRFHFGSDTAIGFPGWDIDDVAIGEPGFRNELSLSSSKEHPESPSRDDRMLSGYNIYRGLENDMANFENWEVLQEVYSDTVYDDETWPQIQVSGIYVYCVRALYSNNVLSLPAFSNPLTFDLEVPVFISVISNSGDPTDGGYVELINQNGNPQNLYTGVISNGEVNWTDVLRGTYDLTIALDNFEYYEQSDVIVNDGTSLQVELVELILPPENPVVDENSGMFTWSLPAIDRMIYPRHNDSKINTEIASKKDSDSEKHATAASRSRNVDYFNIYLDGSLVAQTMQLFSDLSNLSGMSYGEIYTAGVSAHYSSNSESEPAEIEFTCFFANPASGDEIPLTTSLTGNYPNPFNPTTVIRYQMSKEARAQLYIYNSRGHLVKKLVDGTKEAGYYHVSWNGRSVDNKSVSSGIYFYRFITDGYDKTYKMILMK